MTPASTARRQSLPVLGMFATLAAFSAGCSAASNGSFQYESGEQGSSTEIVTAEIRDVEASHSSAHDVIRDLRPAWLRVRSPQSLSGVTEEPIVMLDGVRFGGLSSLYRIDVDDIDRMRYISGLDATTRFGTGFGGGVIEVFGR